jgi:hypothetical protein
LILTVLGRVAGELLERLANFAAALFTRAALYIDTNGQAQRY